MKRLRWLITLPIALLVIAFAIANRQSVVVSLDPFSSEDPALGLRLPLWGVAFATFIFGIAVGGIATWAARAQRWVKRSTSRRADAKSTASVADPLADVPAITPQAAAPMLQPPRQSRARHG